MIEPGSAGATARDLVLGKVFRFVALALWLVGLLAPTAVAKGADAVPGYAALLLGMAVLLVTMPISILLLPFGLLSLASNALVVREAVLAARHRERDVSLRGTFVVYAALFLNYLVVSLLHTRSAPVGSRLASLLHLPGMQLWLASFVVLAGIATYERRRFFSAVAWRVALVGLVAGSVVLLAFATLEVEMLARG